MTDDALSSDVAPVAPANPKKRKTPTDSAKPAEKEGAKRARLRLLRNTASSDKAVLYPVETAIEKTTAFPGVIVELVIDFVGDTQAPGYTIFLLARALEELMDSMKDNEDADQEVDLECDECGHQQSESVATDTYTTTRTLRGVARALVTYGNGGASALPNDAMIHTLAKNCRPKVEEEYYPKPWATEAAAHATSPYYLTAPVPSSSSSSSSSSSPDTDSSKTTTTATS